MDDRPSQTSVANRPTARLACAKGFRAWRGLAEAWAVRRAKGLGAVAAAFWAGFCSAAAGGVGSAAATGSFALEAAAAAGGGAPVAFGFESLGPRARKSPPSEDRTRASGRQGDRRHCDVT